MKLEKREITLNEYDSLKDVFCLEKALMLGYIECLSKSVRKEVRGELLRHMTETGEDMCFALDLMSGSAIENGEK